MSVVYFATACLALVLALIVAFTVTRPSRTPAPPVPAAAPLVPKPATPARKITREEAKKHNRPDDLWLIIDGKVYDFTTYFFEHPGGDAILNNAGGDSTKGFKGDQHPDKVWDLLPEYYIGDLVD